MVLSLLFGKKYAQTAIGSIVLDATISENHNYTARPTTFPIESGQFVTDHIINDPETLEVTGMVSDTPLQILYISNRSVDAFNRLLQIYYNKEVITVVTGIKIYLDMVITELNIPRSIESGQSLTFNITFQKIKFTSSVRVNLNANNPFTVQQDKIPRQIVADANKYPNFENDPNTSFKDQAESPVSVGIQDLLPIPQNILTTVLANAAYINGAINANNTI